jgi:hypothetical protein
MKDTNNNYESDEEFYAIEQQRREKYRLHKERQVVLIADEATEATNYSLIKKLDMPELNARLKAVGISAENITWLNRGEREHMLMKKLKEFRATARINAQNDPKYAESELYRLWAGHRKKEAPKAPETEAEFREKNPTVNKTPFDQVVKNQMTDLMATMEAKQREMENLIAGGMGELSPEIRDRRTEIFSYQSRINMMKAVLQDRDLNK